MGDTLLCFRILPKLDEAFGVVMMVMCDIGQYEIVVGDSG